MPKVHEPRISNETLILCTDIGRQTETVPKQVPVSLQLLFACPPEERRLVSSLKSFQYRFDLRRE